MKMHSPGHSSADSITASSWPSGISAMPAAPLRVALGLREDLAVLDHVGQAIVEEGEHVRGDLLAETVTRAEILVYPDLHGQTFMSGCTSLVMGPDGLLRVPCNEEFTRSSPRKQRRRRAKAAVRCLPRE